MNKIKLSIMIMGLFVGSSALAIDEASTITALRMANAITGGLMPTSDPIFTQMVNQIAAGNLVGAATLAANSKYFANYLARRMALQMQTPALDSSIVTDADGSAFVVAHLVGGPTWKPSISTIWNENQGYLVNYTANGVTTPMHAASLVGYPYSGSLDELDWTTQLIQAGPQTAYTESTVAAAAGTGKGLVIVPIPAQDVGGYTTATTDGKDDSSFAYYGLFGGTNLRFIEGIWEISTGLTLQDLEDTAYASGDTLLAEPAPNFVPENNPNFYVGQNQAACIACHGGGMSSLTKGYSTIADVFDFPDQMLSINDYPAGTLVARKSLGSNYLNRSATLACNLSKTPEIACNPLSEGPLPNQGWDLSSWQANGDLAMMGWTGPVKGDGLNSLGVAIGKAAITYQFLTKRVINEVCPLGSFSEQDLMNIAAAANPYAIPAGTDDIRTIVALVASNPTCQ